MYFVIGVWGTERRIYAAIKFFIYTAFGSGLMLIAIFYLYFAHKTQFGFASMNPGISIQYEYDSGDFSHPNNPDAKTIETHLCISTNV